MNTGLPSFRYHPDPVASGSNGESAEACACCERTTGWIYTATFYTAQDVNGPFCPWCIADGTAAERFEGDFTDSYGLDGVSTEILEHVTRRTPGFHAWQNPHWLVHCNDAAAFIGEVGYTELAAQLEHFLTHLGQSASAILFRCTVCDTHLAYAEAS